MIVNGGVVTLRLKNLILPPDQSVNFRTRIIYSIHFRLRPSFELLVVESTVHEHMCYQFSKILLDCVSRWEKHITIKLINVNY